MRPALVVSAVAGLGLAVMAGLAAWWGLTRLPQATAPALDEPGVSLALAKDRAARVSGLTYAVTVRVPDALSQPVSGHLEATFNLADASTPLLFDFAQPADRLRSVRVNGQGVFVRLRNGHVVIPKGLLAGGRNVVAFDFVSGDAPLNRHDDFLYTLFVPARASLAFPVFEQPDLKARWRLSLRVPKGWSTVSNGAEMGSTETSNARLVTFADTAPIPPYLFAFAAGRFSIETAVRNGRTFRMFHRETDVPRLARNREAIFDLHARALSWMEDYTGIAYPFGKFDFVLIPSFQFGGMEHPGSIFYNANSLLLDQSATQNQFLNRANVISHETAHMWFGDLVTMRWFNDVWMKEVFANFFADRIVNPSFPEINHPLRFLLQNYPAAYDVDRTDGTNPIRQDLANLSEAGSLYGAIIYQKAPIVMRQLERLLGPDAFQAGLRAYLTTYAFGNADWNDLIGGLDRNTSEDLRAWSLAWVETAGRPTITTELSVADGRITRLAVRQSDARNRGVTWPQRIDVLVSVGATLHRFDVTLHADATEIPNAAGLPAPTWVLPTAGGIGYGDFVLDEGTRQFLSREAASVPDALTRGAVFVTLWEEMLAGRLSSATMSTQVFDALATESNELVLQRLLDETRELFWRFTPPANRRALAERLEPLMRGRLTAASSTSEKAAWFSALRSVATTPETIGWLEAVWRREQSIAGLPLTEVDESDMALDLALRDEARADTILEQQLSRFTNPDRRSRFAFIAPALSPNVAVRESFFDGLKTQAGRAHEAWVLDAVRYLHHPLRASTSARLVRPALELVWTIQRTGDIFFPKRWADATLGGYQSADVAKTVEQFIASLPADYPPRLRWVLLSAADPLLRAAKITATLTAR